MSPGRLLAAAAVSVAVTAAWGRAATAPQTPASLFVSPTGSDAASCTAAAPCASLQRAFALAQPGQVVELAAGTYPAQGIGGPPKSSSTHVVFRPAPGAVVAFAGRLTLDGASHVTLQDFQLARPGPSDRSLFVDGCTTDVTLKNLTGETFVMLEGTNDVLVEGGDWGGYGTAGAQDSALGTSGADGPTRTCDGTPAPPAHDIVFDGVTFHDVFWNVPSADWGGSHPDCLEINGYVDGVTVRNSRFERCGSTFLMIGPDQGDIVNVTIERNLFTQLGSEAWYGVQITNGGKPHQCGGIVFRGNTYLPDSAAAQTWPDGPIRTDCSGGVTVEDNVFARAPPDGECSRYLAAPYAAVWADNVFLQGSCGSGSRPIPLGYTADLQRAPQAGAVVQAFRAAAAGTRAPAIAKALSKARAGGRRWSAAQVRAILRNPVYAGGFGALPALVSKGVWTTAQAQA